jgi:hypothetical protein
MNHIYTIESGKLVARAKDLKTFLWDMSFESAKIYKLLPLDNALGCLVLLDPGSSRQPTFENLLLVNPAGEVCWKAELPKSNDAFADVLKIGQGVVARTWTGIRVEVDLATGRTTEIGFSK